MSRSLIRQLDQIRNTDIYDDAIVDFNTSAVAEPVVSGTLEGDLNVIRSMVKQVVGGTNWFDDPGKYFDPTNTNASGIETKQLSLANLKNNTLDSKTIILAVTNDNAGAGYTVTSGTEGILIVPFDTRYADPVMRSGLPIFKSTAHIGTYFDEGGADVVCRVDVLSFGAINAEELVTVSGHKIYAKLHDAADYGGTGEGTDVYVKFYANEVEVDLSNIDGVLPEKIYFIHPFRRRLSSMQEYEWQRTRFTSSWAGDVVLIDDISNLWSYTGASNDATDPGPWTNETASYVLSSSPDSLRSAIDIINTEIGDRSYTEQNYITNGDSISDVVDDLDMAIKDANDAIGGLDTRLDTVEGDIGTINTTLGTMSFTEDNYITDGSSVATSLDNLDMALKDAYDAIGALDTRLDTVEGDISSINTTISGINSTIGSMDFTENNYFLDDVSVTTALDALDIALKDVSDAVTGSAPDKYIESVATDIDANTSHATPAAYTPSATSGREGMNMDVYVDGQLLAADTGADGVNADRDYAETDGTHITFRFKIKAGRNITYVIRQ